MGLANGLTRLIEARLNDRVILQLTLTLAETSSGTKMLTFG